MNLLLWSSVLLVGIWLALHLRLSKEKKPAVVAHRGAAALAPENTLPAIRAGMESGAEFIEIDVQQSSDGALVVIHDTAVDRTTDGSGDVGRLSLAQLKSLDAGRWFSTEFQRTRIPTLQEVFEVIRQWPGVLVIEAKSPSLYPDIGRQLLNVIGSQASRPIIVLSFDHEWLARFKEQAPGIPLGKNDVLIPDLSDDLGVKRVGVHWLAPILDPTLCHRVHRQGMELWVWTVDNPWLQSLLARLGVDGITCNDPAAAVNRLGKTR